MNTLNTFRPELLADPATCGAYLNDTLGESPAALCRALPHVAEAHRLTLPAGDDLELSDVQAVLHAVGLRLSVQPA